jgi:mitochondrial distribution and morphology protein 10
MAIQRLSPSLQVQLNGVSDASLRNGGTILGMLQYDQGKFGLEGLASTDGGLMGIRGIYNWGGDASLEHDMHGSTPREPVNGLSNGKTSDGGQSEREKERIYGRFSAGGEMYYGTLNKSGGISLGVRFATLPGYNGTPLTATLTVNPLMGNIQASYAVVAYEHCAMATQLDFNVYSYESDWSMGMELWGGKWPRVAEEPLSKSPALTEGNFVEVIQPFVKPERRERSFQAKLEWRLDDDDLHSPNSEDESLGVLKARLDQRLNVGLLWEGRIKALLFSLGTNIDMKRLDSPFRSIGLAIQYSS